MKRGGGRPKAPIDLGNTPIIIAKGLTPATLRKYNLKFLTKEYVKSMAERQPPSAWKKTLAPTIGALDSSTGNEEDMDNAKKIWQTILGDFEEA